MDAITRVFARLRGGRTHDHVVLRRAEVRRLAASLPVPAPFTLEAMRDVVAERIQRGVSIAAYPVEVVERAHALGEPLPAAMCFPADGGFFVFYRGEMSAQHRRHSVLHEFGHLLCGHTVPEGGIGRTHYDGAHESAAEEFAYLIEARIGPVRSKPGTQNAAPSPLVDRVGILEG